MSAAQLLRGGKRESRMARGYRGTRRESRPLEKPSVLWLVSERKHMTSASASSGDIHTSDQILKNDIKKTDSIDIELTFILIFQ